MPLTHSRCCGLYYLGCIGVINMEPEEYKGFMIVEAPGQMFKATKIVSSGHFKRSLNACTVESLKISIDYTLEKMKPINRNKPVNNQG